ncbi:hypothetical protein [Shewanella algae]|uniref:Uncharacterized protein n=1 Tax=Shewanella algae TaxID=38313 RepID=A0A379YKZ3_9GAMM|nr:hypothetical protein [Shewanella algae]MBO2606928.1 hypothetical protein [Shewanella algae]SUI46380.1 Uncharacterised protein [Shewanella algae]
MSLSKVIKKMGDGSGLDAFKGRQMTTAELLATMGSAAETDRRRARLKAAGLGDDEIADKLLQDAQERLRDLDAGRLVPSRNHGNRDTIRES